MCGAALLAVIGPITGHLAQYSWHRIMQLVLSAIIVCPVTTGDHVGGSLLSLRCPPEQGRPQPISS